MPGYYVYFISSLPLLRFGTRPPCTFVRFIEMCKGVISDNDIETLKNISLLGLSSLTFHYPIIERFSAFDVALRNELVKIRSSRNKLDPYKYLRQDGYDDLDVVHIAMAAYRSLSPIEAERILDEARWYKLDELLSGHYFDLDCLIVYAYKLLILERWEKIRLADKKALLEEALTNN